MQRKLGKSKVTAKWKHTANMFLFSSIKNRLNFNFVTPIIFLELHRFAIFFLLQVKLLFFLCCLINYQIISEDKIIYSHWIPCLAECHHGDSRERSWPFIFWIKKIKKNDEKYLLTLSSYLITWFQPLLYKGIEFKFR